MPAERNPTVTVIIPTYRRPQLLQDAVRSVLRQTYADLKVCVYDNASGDDTKDVVAALAREDSRVHYYCNPENLGAYENFRRGMQNVSTPFFSFLSDDDILLPKFLEVGLEGLNQHPDAMFCAAATIIVTPEMKPVAAPILSWSREGIFHPPDSALEMIRNHATWTSILFRKAVIDKIGVIDPDINGVMDLDYQLQIAIRYPIVITKQPAALFTSHDESNTGCAKLDHFWPGWKNMVDKIKFDETIPKSHREQVERSLHALFNKTLISLAVKLMIRGEIAEVDKIAEIVDRYPYPSPRGKVLRLGGRFCYIPGFRGLLAFATSTVRSLKVLRRKTRWKTSDFRNCLNSMRN
jgi:glycosyltransferase involved in cell wall biosynthesis